jgi:hypothetical protein
MTGLRKLLADTDPLRRDPALSPLAVHEMRSRVLAASERAPVFQWTWSLTLAAGLVAVVTAGIAATRPARPAALRPRAPHTAAADPSPRPERRQLQFATPGGTRVIWVFNADFEMR